jgi:hypothetical protein
LGPINLNPNINGDPSIKSMPGSFLCFSITDSKSTEMRYELIIYWSKEDNAFPRCMADAQ